MAKIPTQRAAMARVIYDSSPQVLDGEAVAFEDARNSPEVERAYIAARALMKAGFSHPDMVMPKYLRETFEAEDNDE